MFVAIQKINLIHKLQATINDKRGLHNNEDFLKEIAQDQKLRKKLLSPFQVIPLPLLDR